MSFDINISKIKCSGKHGIYNHEIQSEQEFLVDIHIYISDFFEDNINKTINSAKPPIFWKEKNIVKIQLNKWKPEKIRKLIDSINNIELETKKNFNNSILITTNFILEKGCSDYGY